MINRSLNMKGISTVIETVDLAKVKEDNAITNTAPISSIVGTITSKNKVLNNEVAEVIHKYCDETRPNKVSKDYLYSLDRELKNTTGYGICDNLKKKNMIDSILLSGVKKDITKDLSSVAKNSINKEFSELGYGSIPDCVYDKLLSKLSGLGEFNGFSGLPLKKILDLEKLLGGGCVKETVTMAGNAVMDTEVSKSLLSGLFSEDVNVATKYIGNKLKAGHRSIIDTLQATISEDEGHNTYEKLVVLKELNVDHNLNYGRVVSNLENDTLITNYPGIKFKVVESVFNGKETPTDMFSNTPELAKVALAESRNTVSKSDLSTTKTTNLSLADQILINNIA